MILSDDLKTSINTATQQSKNTDSINNKIGTFFIDVTHDTISVLHNNKVAGHDDSVVSKSTKTGASVCSEFITTEGNTKLECDTLDYFNPINCYVYDSFRGRNLKGVNNYIDSANTPSLENFLKEYSLDVSDTSALNIKDPRLIWNIYTNKDALIHLYIKMILSNTQMGMITNSFLLSIQKLNKEYNTDHEKFISVINGNFLWQTTLYYCYKIISDTAKDQTDQINNYKQNSILHNSIQLLRQIQFTSINDKIQESDAFNWCIGFDNPAVVINYNDDDVTNDRIKNFNKRIYDHFSIHFFDTLTDILPGAPVVPPQPINTIDVNLDMISNEYCFIGTQPLVGSLLKELHPTSTIHARNENNTPKNKSMINGLNQLFNHYFIKSRINDTDQKKRIKTLCLQIIKFAGDSSHINMCYLVKNAWNLIVNNDQYSIDISANGDYNHTNHGAALNPTKDNKIDTIILTGERIVPVRCIQETISFYVKNFNPFKTCSKNNSEILHYTSDFRTQFSSIINKYISYLEDTYIINGIIHSKYYTLFNKLKLILNKHSKLKVEHKDIWKLVPSTEQLYKTRMNQYLLSLISTQIGINLYIDYIEYFKNLSFLDIQTRIIEGGTFKFDGPNSYFNVLHTDNNLRFDNKYVVILKQFLRIYNTDCDPSMYLFKDIFIDNKMPNIFNGILYPTSTNLLKIFDENVKTEFKTALLKSNFHTVFPNIFYYMACKINMYPIISQRAGRGEQKFSSHPQLKEYEEKQFWYSLFPYNGTFNEKGIEDFKIILDATTLQGTGIRDVYINNLKDTFLLLFEFFIQNDPKFTPPFFDNINALAIVYNTELDNCKEFMLLINKFIVVNKNIIQSHNNLIKDYENVIYIASKAKPNPLPAPELMDYIHQNYKTYTNGLIDLLTHYEEMVNIFSILIIKTEPVAGPPNLIQNLKTSFDKFVVFLNLLIKKAKPGAKPVSGDDINWGIINYDALLPIPHFEPVCPDKKSTPTDDIFNCDISNTNIIKQLFDRQLYLKKYNTGMFQFYDNISNIESLKTTPEKKTLPPDFVRFTKIYFDVNTNIKVRFNTALKNYKTELSIIFPTIKKLNEQQMLGGAAAEEENDGFPPVVVVDEVELFISNNLNPLFDNVIDNDHIPTKIIEHLVTIYEPSFNINTIHIEYNNYNYKDYISFSEFVKIICRKKPKLQLTTPQFNIWKKSINIYLTMKKIDINIQTDCIDPLILISDANQAIQDTKQITMSEIYLYIHKQIDLYGCTIIYEIPSILVDFNYNDNEVKIHYSSIVEKINTKNIVNILKLNKYEKYILEYYIIETFILIFLIQSSTNHSYIDSTSIELIIINIYNELCYYCSYNFIKMLDTIKLINGKLHSYSQLEDLIHFLMRQVIIKNVMLMSSRVMLRNDDPLHIKNMDESDTKFKTYFKKIYGDDIKEKIVQFILKEKNEIPLLGEKTWSIQYIRAELNKINPGLSFNLPVNYTFLKKSLSYINAENIKLWLDDILVTKHNYEIFWDTLKVIKEKKKGGFITRKIKPRKIKTSRRVKY